MTMCEYKHEMVALYRDFALTTVSGDVALTNNLSEMAQRAMPLVNSLMRKPDNDLPTVKLVAQQSVKIVEAARPNGSPDAQ